MEQPDPAIEAIRDVRKEISRRFGNDPVRLVAYLRDIERRFKDRVQHGPGEAEMDRAGELPPEPPYPPAPKQGSGNAVGISHRRGNP